MDAYLIMRSRLHRDPSVQCTCADAIGRMSECLIFSHDSKMLQGFLEMNPDGKVLWRTGSQGRMEREAIIK